MSKRNCFLSKRCPNCRTGWAGSHPPVLPGTAPSGPLPGLGSEGAFSGQISDSNNERYNGQILITFESDAELTTKLATCNLWSKVSLKFRPSHKAFPNFCSANKGIILNCKNTTKVQLLWGAQLSGLQKIYVIKNVAWKTKNVTWGADFFIFVKHFSHTETLLTLDPLQCLRWELPYQAVARPHFQAPLLHQQQHQPRGSDFSTWRSHLCLFKASNVCFVELYRTPTRQLEHRLKHQLKFWQKAAKTRKEPKIEKHIQEHIWNN